MIPPFLKQPSLLFHQLLPFYRKNLNPRPPAPFFHKSSKNSNPFIFIKGRFQLWILFYDLSYPIHKQVHAVVYFSFIAGKVFFDVSPKKTLLHKILTRLVLSLNRMMLKLAIGFIMTKTIVKFPKRKVCQQVLWVKKALKNIDPSEFDFPEGAAIFINGSLCSCYKMLWNKCKKLWEKKVIYTHFTSNVNIQYRIRENRNVHTVTHTADFKKNFPDIVINDL